MLEDDRRIFLKEAIDVWQGLIVSKKGIVRDLFFGSIIAEPINHPVKN